MLINMVNHLIMFCHGKLAHKFKNKACENVLKVLSHAQGMCMCMHMLMKMYFYLLVLK
jgi:prephenate dehydratase